MLGNFMGFRFAMYRASDAPRFLSVVRPSAQAHASHSGAAVEHIATAHPLAGCWYESHLPIRVSEHGL